MEVKEPIYCALAFGSASIDGRGYKPCCNVRPNSWKRNADHFNHANLIEIRELLTEGDWPKACYNCKEQEETSGTSMRTIWNDALKDYDIPVTSIVDPNNVYYLDLTFSNKCNSKCMTCNPDASDQWGKEYGVIWKGLINEADKIQQTDNHLQIYIEESAAIDIYNTYPNVTRIAFVGGEPTIMEEHTKYCQQLIDGDRAKNITLSYVSNLTGITNKLLEMWTHFKEIHISLSIDGYGKVNDYIRYPFKWAKIEKNTRLLFDLRKKEPHKYSLNLSHTVSVFNIIQSPKLLNWWCDLCDEYGCPRDVRPGLFLNQVTEPIWAKTNIVSLEYRQQAIKEVEELKSKIATFNVDQLDILHSWLVEPQHASVLDAKRLYQLITGSDEYRNRKLKDYIPELAEELDTKFFNSIQSELQHEGKGYDLAYDIIPTPLLDAVADKLDSCYPVRASTHKKQYAEAEDTKKLHGIAVWWSQLTDEWEEVQKINDIVFPKIQTHMPNAEFYASDIVTINGPSRWVGPHVDTPHRFERYNNMATDLNFELLGIQVIIPLETIDADSGATGLLPYSHRQDWNIQDCYDGHFDDMFKEEAVQHDMPKGSMLFYNTRLLHSTMPMHLPKKRSILLLNYLRRDIIKTVKKIDNVWTSNGK
jgi:sulfatase maturation enzyme AslB (radical SAM superfamily)